MVFLCIFGVVQVWYCLIGSLVNAHGRVTCALIDNALYVVFIYMYVSCACLYMVFTYLYVSHMCSCVVHVLHLLHVAFICRAHPLSIKHDPVACDA